MRRTFSGLTATPCNHGELLDLLHRPSERRTAAADVGTAFHKCAVEWIDATRAGQPFFAGDYSPQVLGWLHRMRGAFTVPFGIECELPLGLADVDGEPRYVPVKETEPHVYEPVSADAPALLTAGRADLVWPSLFRETVRVVDIKTGRDYLGRPDRIVQLLACGFAAALRGGFLGFRVGVYYARAAAFDWAPTIPVLDRDAWRLVVDAARRDNEPHPGAHCLGCWHSPHRKASGRCAASAVEE